MRLSILHVIYFFSRFIPNLFFEDITSQVWLMIRSNQWCWSNFSAHCSLLLAPCSLQIYNYFYWHLILFNCVQREDEPGKQVRSAIGIKNTCKSHVAFKVWNIYNYVVSSLLFYFFCWYSSCVAVIYKFNIRFRT